jgi:Holliday junction resolvasome RuvABC DNA-binding subunit
MAQDLTVNIKTTSDVPQAMDRAKQATTEFGKQAEAVNKRFKDSIKDILLSTVGPMAALALVTNRINEYFEKIKQAQADANQSAIDGINERMAKEDVYYARKVARLKEDKKESESARLQPQTTAFEFLMNDPRAGAEFGFKPSKQPAFGLPGVTAGEQIAETLSARKSIQERVRQIIAEDLAKNGMIPKGGEGVKDKTATNFKGPEGFSNVVGVGSNPVMEAMAAQTEIALQQLAELQKLNAKANDTQTDFTKDSK